MPVCNTCVVPNLPQGKGVQVMRNLLTATEQFIQPRPNVVLNGASWLFNGRFMAGAICGSNRSHKGSDVILGVEYRRNSIQSGRCRLTLTPT
jgi:hypothetical protein